MLNLRPENNAVLRPRLALVLLLLSLASGPALAQRLGRDAALPPSVHDLSGRLAALQRVLEREFGLGELYLGGGSSRAVLDAVYFGKELKTRDIDLFVVPGRKVNERFAATVASRLQAGIATPLVLSSLEKRPRGNGALAGPAAARYNAGFGFFLTEPGGDVFDLSLYHTRGDLALNGAFDIDTIMIPVRAGETLAKQLERLRGKSYGQAVREGLVVDRYQGYRSWQKNRLRVAHPAELQSKPALWAIRAARSFGKAGYESLPAEVVKNLAVGDERFHQRPPLTLVKRYLERLLNDPHPERELKLVQQTGVLARHPGVVRLLGAPSTWTPEQLRARLARANAGAKP